MVDHREMALKSMAWVLQDLQVAIVPPHLLLNRDWNTRKSGLCHQSIEQVKRVGVSVRDS